MSTSASQSSSLPAAAFVCCADDCRAVMGQVAGTVGRTAAGLAEGGCFCAGCDACNGTATSSATLSRVLRAQVRQGTQFKIAQTLI